jgi:Skp family chaperone for outer membrane proteins
LILHSQKTGSASAVPGNVTPNLIEENPMLTKSALLRAAAVTALVGGIAFASPVYAASATASSSSSAPATASAPKGYMDVETRIKNLHDKLNISADQEDAWTGVAQAMRDDEAATKALVDDRHQNAATMTAIEDLESYQKIVQSHVDGLSKLITAFEPLYNSMSEDQKKNADEVFGRFEGHRGGAAKAASKKTTK